MARTLSVVGDRWTLLILRDAFLGVRRFEDFQAVGLTRHRLADRLRRLVAGGRAATACATRTGRRASSTGSPRRAATSTRHRRRSTRWGDRWMAGDAGPPVELVHRGCGHAVMPVLACPHCAEPVTARDMRARPGPALRGRHPISEQKETS